MVIEKVRTDGLVPTLEAVLGKLDQPLPMGYCNVGTVVAVGRRASQGLPSAIAWSRTASTPRSSACPSICAHVCRTTVSDDAAAFAVLGAIALQGIRLAAADARRGGRRHRPRSARTAHGPAAAGARLPGSWARLRRATSSSWRASSAPDTVDFEPRGSARSGEAVLARARASMPCSITAATSSSEPVHQAALMSRKRGRIVLGGRCGARAVARGLLREGAHVPSLLLLRSRPLRSELRRAWQRLSRRVRALDGAAQSRSRARHAGRAPPRRSRRCSRIGSRSTMPPRRTSSSTAPSRRSASCSTIRGRPAERLVRAVGRCARRSKPASTAGRRRRASEYRSSAPVTMRRPC